MSNISAADLAKFAKITEMSMIDQAKHFLKEFVFEISATEEGFEGVLKLCEEFAGFTEDKDPNSNKELEEHTFHLFLERRGETKTVKEVRDAIREIDVDANMKISFIEFCLFKYEKTVAELLAPKIADAKLLAELNEAIALYEEVMRARKEEEDTMQELSQLSVGSGVKAMKAKMQLESMRVRSQTGQNIAEVRAAFKKRRAQKAVGLATGPSEEERDAALKKNEDEVAAKKQAEEEAKSKAAAESKQRLKDRSAAFGQ